MLAGASLTLIGNLYAVLAGIVNFVFGFFGAHSIASGLVGDRAAAESKAQASSLYLLFYYAGSRASSGPPGAALETLRLVLGRDLPHDPPAPGVRRDGGPTCPAKRASAPKRPGLRAPERPPKDCRQTSPVLHPRPTSGETGCEASRGTTPKPLPLRRPESRRAEVPKAIADGALARHRLELTGLVGLPGNSLPSLSAIHSATPMRASRSIPSRAPCRARGKRGPLWACSPSPAGLRGSRPSRRKLWAEVLARVPVCVIVRPGDDRKTSAGDRKE
jgi:hypothetical protein